LCLLESLFRFVFVFLENWHLGLPFVCLDHK